MDRFQVSGLIQSPKQPLHMLHIFQRYHLREHCRSWMDSFILEVISRLKLTWHQSNERRFLESLKTSNRKRMSCLSYARILKSTLIKLFTKRNKVHLFQLRRPSRNTWWYKNLLFPIKNLKTYLAISLVTLSFLKRWQIASTYLQSKTPKKAKSMKAKPKCLTISSVILFTINKIELMIEKYY